MGDYSKKILQNGHRSENLKMDSINVNLGIMPPYGIRGLLLKRACEIEEEIKQGVQKPFKKVIHTTVGCCHSGGQTPITFARQLLAAITYPNLLGTDDFPSDVKEKARFFLESVPGGSIGSYSATPGIPLVRQLAAKYIEERDGIKTNWKNIYLTNGASGAIFHLLNLLNNSAQSKKMGVLNPLPEYPLYSAILNALGMINIGYYLDEEKEWSINVEELQKMMDALKQNCTIKAMIVINPNNPTGHVLSKKNIQGIAKFCNKNGLMLIADEVYQMNIHNENVKFHSFKKVIDEMNLTPNNITLASLMSVSKCYLGECGLRGGYVDLDNMDPNVQETFEKSLIFGLCPSTYGQAALYCLFNSPKVGELSYELFRKEKMELENEMKKKAKLAEDAFNSMQGFHCSRINGSLYAFAKVTFPPGVLKMATKLNQEPDYLYSKELLESTGISLVAGSSFGQKPGTYHVRITLLSHINILRELFEILNDFHKKFLDKYDA